jgi:hypothetical protein
VTNVVKTNDLRYLAVRLVLLLTAVLTSVLAVGQNTCTAPCIQVNGSPNNGSQKSVTVPYTLAQTAGDLNVVVVGWSDTTATVAQVADSSLNTYALAAGTNAGSRVSQVIYYAQGIAAAAANTNSVTVTFNGTATSPDVRILEFSGVATTFALDIWAGAAGNAATADSGAATTSGTGDLIVGAGTNTVSFSGGGAGFTVDAPAGGNPFGDIVEHMVAGGTTADAKATNSGGVWVMQVVAFRTTPGSALPAPTVTSVNPNSGPDTGGTGVTITGTNFAPGAVALFGTHPGGISGVNCTVANATTIGCSTPAHSPAGVDVTVVNVDGGSGFLTPAAFTYTQVVPTISGVSPNQGPTNGGTPITISGTNFESSAVVTVGGRPGAISSMSATSISTTTAAFPVGPADVKVTNPDGGTFTLTGGFSYTLGSGPINFVQSADSGSAPTSGTTITATMAQAEAAGDLNVVVVGWSDTQNHTVTIIDTEGNKYTPALPAQIAPATLGLTGVGQVIFYAKNINGGGPDNAIIVTYSPAAAFPDVRVAEYTGLDPNNPLDAVASNASTTAGAQASSGSLTTTAANEVVVGGMTTDLAFSAPGPGFVTVDDTANGNAVEHDVVSSTGSYTAAATLTAAGDWVMQAVSFKSGAATPDFGIVANAPTSATVNAGSPASYALTLTALDNFNSAVSLSCSGLPAGASCSFSPSSPVTPTSSGLAETLTINTSSATPGGTSTVTIKGTSQNLNHSAQVTLTVNGSTAPGFIMAATALSPASVSPGGSATSTITLTGENGFNVSNVTLACSSITGGGSPAPACSFSAVSGGTSTLTVSTTGSSAANKSLRSTGVFYAMLLPIGGMTLLGAGFTSRRKKLLGILLICLVISGLVFMVACGGGSSNNGGGGGGGGTPAGTYTITVSGTATGATTQTQTLTLTVQ